MDRSTFTLGQTIRTMFAILTAFVCFATTVHVVGHGIATPAVADAAGGEISGFVERSNGAGLVLFVSLQRS